MWAPDVYEGAPTTVTAFMAAGVKVAAFGVFLRIFAQSAAPARLRCGSRRWPCSPSSRWSSGTWARWRRRNLKRMLAYSSVAHAGY